MYMTPYKVVEALKAQPEITIADLHAKVGGEIEDVRKQLRVLRKDGRVRYESRTKTWVYTPIAACDFALAIVKGLVEHNDAYAYFGSLMGFQYHKHQAIARGHVIDDRGGLLLTDAGRAAYTAHKLDTLPKIHLSRASSWDWRNTIPYT